MNIYKRFGWDLSIPNIDIFAPSMLAVLGGETVTPADMVYLNDLPCQKYSVEFVGEPGTKTAAIFDWAGRRCTIEYSIYHPALACRTFMVNVAIDPEGLIDADITRDGIKVDNELHNLITTDIQAAIVNTIIVLRYADSNKLHAATHEHYDGAKQPSKGKKRKARTPTIVYLNKLPSSSAPVPGILPGLDAVTGPRASHVRRAHRRTLRDKRYRNHPLFMVDNAVRVQQSFVGDRECISAGRIYKILPVK